MKKTISISLVVVLSLLLGLNWIFANEVIWENISQENLNVRTALVYPENPHIIIFGSGSGVFKTEDAGLNWRSILTVKGQNNSVNFLLSEPENKNSLYAATGNGLFYSHNMGTSWQRIFQGKNYSEAECTVLEVTSYAIYLGTRNGLFVSKDRGKSWYKGNGVLAKSHILAIDSNPKETDYIYVACVDGVFRTKDAGQSWERIFGANPTEDGDDVEEKSNDFDEEERNSCIRYIKIEPENPTCLYLTTSHGVYRSQDRGTNWESVSSYGLLDKDVKFLLVSNESNLYAVTKRSIFVYEQDRWYELSQRLLAQEVRFLAQDNHDNLYAACDKGLFKGRILNLDNGNQGQPPSIYLKNEPSIKEVQEAAIRYAEVEPGKIQEWRKLAAKKAWMPQVSVGFNRDTTDFLHWESGSTTKTDDDTLRKGKDTIDWDISLSWDLGELIWNDDQTSIDVRSRLMVELRDDILDEVTKLYFERVRVKMEIDNLSIEDRKKRAEKELRLQELTANLDGLTGGYFSAHLSNKTGS
jgi:hypothetical protein